MGNSVPISLGNYSGSAQFPSHHQLGRFVAIDLSTRVIMNRVKGLRDEWKVLYTVDGSTCELNLQREVDKDGNVKIVYIQLCGYNYLKHDPMCLTIYTVGKDFLIIHHHVSSVKVQPIMWTKQNRIVHAWGGVTDTKVYLHGSGNRGGLLVYECKKNSDTKTCGDFDGANAVTVAYYFANGGGTAFNRTESDIGLSVVAKFGGSNGHLDVTVEGPKQHPVSALFYMFDEVNRTGIWKPTMCTHCANIRRGSMFWQSDSEDSDSVPRNSLQNASIANGGRFRGNGNGSSIICKYFYGF